ncbi:hypothetical protein LIA77_10705 [Sarocladium implicatum]|nr:hypothetical protein LIA77_10705 [Sarocladium implicatum]
MGNVPSSSKSRRQHPQYNPDNESSAQLGAASSEHLRSLPLAKWDTHTSDDEDKSLPLAAPVPKIGKSKKSTSFPISCGCNNKFPRREKSSVGRASIETVRGSPASNAGTAGGRRAKKKMTGTDDGNAEMHKGDVGGGETWGTANEPFCDRELAGIGGWIWDVGHKGGK